MSIAARLAGNATELSRKTGISRRAIGTYLAGGSEPTLQRLVAIATASGVSVEWLATGMNGRPCRVSQPGLAQLSADTVMKDKRDGVQGPKADEVPIPLYSLSSHHFSQSDCFDGANTESLYMNSEMLECLVFSDLSNLRAIHITGERVTPVGIGNTLLVDFDPQIEAPFQAGVFLLRKSGHLQVSTLYPNQPHYLRTYNCDSDDATEIFDPFCADVSILGKVIWSCGKAC